MSDDISVRILSQTSESIQKLFDLSTRIDERCKTVQNRQEELDKRLGAIIEKHMEIIQKVAVLESAKEQSFQSGQDFGDVLKELEDSVSTIDRRLAAVESSEKKSQDRWKDISSFVVQLVWIILAAWLLMKFNLSPPL